MYLIARCHACRAFVREAYCRSGVHDAEDSIKARDGDGPFRCKDPECGRRAAYFEMVEDETVRAASIIVPNVIYPFGQVYRPAD